MPSGCIDFPVGIMNKIVQSTPEASNRHVDINHVIREHLISASGKKQEKRPGMTVKCGGGLWRQLY